MRVFPSNPVQQNTVKAEGLKQLVTEQAGRKQEVQRQTAEKQKYIAFENVKLKADFSFRVQHGIERGDFLPTSTISILDGENKKLLDLPPAAVREISRKAKLQFLGRYIDTYI